MLLAYSCEISAYYRCKTKQKPNSKNNSSFFCQAFCLTKHLHTYFVFDFHHKIEW